MSSESSSQSGTSTIQGILQRRQKECRHQREWWGKILSSWADMTISLLILSISDYVWETCPKVGPWTFCQWWWDISQYPTALWWHIGSLWLLGMIDILSTVVEFTISCHASISYSNQTYWVTKKKDKSRTVISWEGKGISGSGIGIRKDNGSWTCSKYITHTYENVIVIMTFYFV